MTATLIGRSEELSEPPQPKSDIEAAATEAVNNRVRMKDIPL
jgi:hypothetical protein